MIAVGCVAMFRSCVSGGVRGGPLTGLSLSLARDGGEVGGRQSVDPRNMQREARIPMSLPRFAAQGGTVDAGASG